MNMILAKDIVSLTDFARQTRKHTDELKKTRRPRVLTHNGKATAVVLSVDAYQKLADEAHERQMDLRLQAAVEAYAQGERGVPLDEAFQQLRKRLTSRSSAR